ncbi:NEAT domain-containing protein [uncultured Ruminococcus sp.]|uniref:NEAT domain-containing protein n=1 Tax=uncultured Ruminococcus sp. TaxID=165186 RepID=UPI0025D5B9CA|nr:NEAT domain-containing protein [uncultured Ruminococcus sp.]
MTLTDPTTGVSILTTTKYVSKNAALMSTEIAEDSDAYKSMLSHCENIYNTMSYRQYYVVDNGQLVTDLGTLVMEFPVTETMNKRGLGIFRTKYIPDYDAWDWQMFGAEDTTGYNGYIVGDKYMFIGKLSLEDCIGFYDSKSADTTGETLEDGTYEVPIAIFNVSSPSSTSMAQSCVGSTAKLVVKNGKKRLELNFNPVVENDLFGYVIQMWNQVNGDWREVNYTSYYKNEDGSYFTDELNQGTNNYYPKTAYIELPNDAGQFKAKFRVSAMDAIMGNTGDATRNGIFTIYYDEAKKISDETPDPDPIEDPDFEPADMTKLEALVAQAEGFNEDDYTTSTFTTMKNALASARTVLANSRATQEEVDSAVSELQSTIDALEKKQSEPELDINNLPDGKYQLYAQMIKTDRESFSMSNEGINHTVQLEVVNGEYYITVQFKGLAIYNQFGYLQNLYYYDKGYTYNEYGIPQGDIIPAEVLSTYDVVDQYNTADTPYPQLLKFKLVDKAGEKFVPLQVFVPIMEAISDGTGTQDVLMQIDWSTLTKTDKDIEIEDPEEQSPALDYTDDKTGVKIHADKGVFAEGTTAEVTEITSGNDFDSATQLISYEADKFHLYDIAFKGSDGNEAKPNGKISVSIPVPSDYANPVVYRIADGKKTLISGTTADGMFTFSAKEAGQYLIEDKKTGTSDNKSDNKNSSSSSSADSKTNAVNGSSNADPTTGAATKAGLLAVLSGAVLVFTKKRKDR